MISIVHPLADELLGLVENGSHDEGCSAERDTSWRWMVGAVVVIGAFAWFTR